MITTLKNKAGRLLLCAGTVSIMSVALAGCQSAARQADDFGSGADRAPTPRTLHMMAKLINENGRTDQAEFVLLRILSDSPEYLPAYVELADLYIEQARFGDAVATLQSAHSTAPNDAVIANNLGVLLLREGSFVEASEVFRTAVELEATEARYHANLAVSLAMQGAYNEAFDAWTAVLPTEEVFWNLGIVAEARGNTDQAGDYFASANRIRNGAESDAEVESGELQTVTVSVPVD